MFGRTDLENPNLDVSLHILAPLSPQSTPHRLTYFILVLRVFLLGHPRALTQSCAWPLLLCESVFSPLTHCRARHQCLNNHRAPCLMPPFWETGLLFDLPGCVISPRRALLFENDDKHVDNHHEDKIRNSLALQSAYCVPGSGIHSWEVGTLSIPIFQMRNLKEVLWLSRSHPENWRIPEPMFFKGMMQRFSKYKQRS